MATVPHTQTRHYSCRAGATPFAAALAFLLIGCTTVRSEPFHAFADANRQLRDGTDESIVAVHGWAQERFVTEVTDGGEDAAQALLLEPNPDDPFAWTAAVPTLPLQILQFRTGFARLNSALIGYSDALAQLASNEIASDDQFTNLAKNLNTTARSAGAALQAKDGAAKEVAIISVAAAQAFQEFIVHHRRSALQLALQENQVNLREVSALAREATLILAQALRNEYDLRSGPLAQQLAPAAKPNKSARRKTVKAFLKLNEEYVARLELLGTLDRAYATLPDAHAQLARALENTASPLGQVTALSDHAQRLNRLYEELSKPGP